MKLYSSRINVSTNTVRFIGQIVVSTGQLRCRYLAPVLSVVAMSVAVAGCVQSSATSTRMAQPAAETAAIATTDPVVLSGVAYTQGDAMTAAKAAPPPSPRSDIVTAPAGSLRTDVKSAPLPANGAASSKPPVASASAASPAETGEYPNINLPPQQPEGKLLSAAERAKLIQELNALAGR